MPDNLPEKAAFYITCPTCGKYILTDRMETGGCCSVSCAVAYGECITCGRHVPREELHENFFCCSACAVQYRFLKTLGPQPVVITSDQSMSDPDDILI